MPMTDAERQQKRRDKMTDANYVQVAYWVRKDRKHFLDDFAKELDKYPEPPVDFEMW